MDTEQRTDFVLLAELLNREDTLSVFAHVAEEDIRMLCRLHVSIYNL